MFIFVRQLRLIISLPLLFGTYFSAQPNIVKPIHLATGISLQFVQPLPTPDLAQQYNNQVLIPLHAAQAAQTAQEAATALAAQQVANTPVYTPAPVTTPVVASYGNNYDYGECTYWVASKVSVPQSMGDATNWSYGLLDAGWNQGVARAGAIGVSHLGIAGHVVYVESVNADGSVNISEMNALLGWNQVDYRTVGASDFQWFYQ